MRHLSPLIIAIVAALVAAPPAGSTTALTTPGSTPPKFVPGEVIVGFDNDSSRSQQLAAADRAGVEPEQRIAGDVEQVEIVDEASVAVTVEELRDDPSVTYATPNYTTQIAGFDPNDPGQPGGGAGDWRKLQWNFAGAASVRALGAWKAARQRGAPGGDGVKVAVLDTGVAYLDRDRYERAPDLASGRWLDGRDYVDGDKVAYDENDDGDTVPNRGMGHGTHVTGTIRQATDNGRAVTGLAYRAKVMPVRVLDVNGHGDTADLIRGIRFAARHDADVINMSLEVTSFTAASEQAALADAIDLAHRRGAVIVAAAGNHDALVEEPVAAPARLKHVIAVGATTANGCRADYSRQGAALDLVAPGGGGDARPQENAADLASCRPHESGPPVFQQTWDCDDQSTRACTRFGLPGDFKGTSMSAPHVSAAAALVIATGRARDPAAVERRLEDSARDLGASGPDERYGAGLLDAAAALR